MSDAPNEPVGFRIPNNELMREQIKIAALAIAEGIPRKDVAEMLGLSTSLDWMRRYYSLYWRGVWEAAVRTSLARLYADAGTERVLDDPDAHIRRARICYRWAKRRRIELFPIKEPPTLRTFFEEYYRPVCLGAAVDETVYSYRLVIWRWTVVTGDPPLKSITAKELALFRDFLSLNRGMQRGSKRSPNSTRMYLRHLQAVLDKAGPPARRNRDAAGVIQTVPYVRPPRQLRRVPKIATFEELSKVYAACDGMVDPEIPGIMARDWWKALLVVAFYTGLRRRDLFTLKLGDVDWENACLHVEHHKTGVGSVIPLHPCALRHLEAIRTERELVFPWPRGMEMFYDRLHRLQDAAGLTPARRFGLHTIRRTFASTMWACNPQAAALVLGHTTAETTRRHYVDGQAMLAKAMANMPEPWDNAGLPLN